MDLGRDRPAALGQPVEQRHLPERVGTVEPVRVEVAEPVEQLLVSPGRGQRRVADVRGDVEGPVVHPDPAR